jgi:hypothetical protein
MISCRVDRLSLLLEKLEKDGVKVERKEGDPGMATSLGSATARATWSNCGSHRPAARAIR